MTAVMRVTGFVPELLAGKNKTVHREKTVFCIVGMKMIDRPSIRLYTTTNFVITYKKRLHFLCKVNIIRAWTQIEGVLRGPAWEPGITNPLACRRGPDAGAIRRAIRAHDKGDCYYEIYCYDRRFFQQQRCSAEPDGRCLRGSLGLLPELSVLPKKLAGAEPVTP